MSFNRCLNRVQENRQAQLKVIQTEQSKSATKMHTETDELQYLVNFNQSISQCVARTMELLDPVV